MDIEIEFYLNGGDEDIAIDNIVIEGLSSGAVANPTNFTATTNSSSQIDLSFTPNGNNDNVVIVFDSDGSFTTPTGAPPAIGDPFAGGEVLSNGTTSPVNHTGLNSNEQVFYSAFSYDGSDFSSGVTDDAITARAEPTAHVTAFTATANGSSQIDLSWTDATGTPAPENYLIKVNTGAITPPSDGSAETDDTDLSDNAGALNIAQGTESATFTGLSPNTTYNFEIYPYTNSGSNIDYKTDGTVPADNATTDEFSSSLIISQYVDTGSGSTPKGIELWNVSGSQIDFSVTELIVNRFANGSSSATEEAKVSTGTLAAGAVMVIGGSDLQQFMSVNHPTKLFIDDSFFFNGDDALEVVLDNSRQDVFGTIGTDPGSAWSGNGVSTADQNIALRPGITEGNANGFTDPSLRFETIDETVAPGTGDLAGFGTAPDDGGTLFLNGNEGFRLLSIPTTGTSFADLLDPLWTQGIATGADITNGDPNVFTWDNNSSDGSTSNFTALTDLTATPGASTGFLAFVFEDDDGESENIQGGFPKTLSLSGSENTGQVKPTVNTNGGGFTLLGNPYASTIDFDELTLSDPNDFTGVVYAWDPNDGGGDGGSPMGSGGSWKTWNSTAGDLSGGLIAPFQGFFIENSATVGTPSVTIEEADKASGGTFLGKENKEEPLVVRLKLTGTDNELNNTTWISFTENGSRSQRVHGDALKLQSLSGNFVQLATTKPGLTTLLDINQLPIGFENTVDIPLEIIGNISGTFTLSATDFNLPQGLSLTFNNLETGESIPMGPDFETIIELRVDQDQDRQSKASAGSLVSAPARLTQTTDEESAAYSITIEPNVITSVDEEGLNLPEKVELNQNFPNPFNPTTTIRFALPESQQVSLEVYDLLGRRVAQLLRNEVRSAGSHSVNFDAASLSSGVYIYQLRAEGGATITRKLTLIK